MCCNLNLIIIFEQIDSLELNDSNILLLYTSKASIVGHPQNSAKLFIEQTNQSALNSKADVQFTLAGVEPIAFHERSTIWETRDEIQKDEIANQLRIDAEADIVVLLNKGDWKLNGFTYLGIAFLSKWGQKEYAFSVVEIDAGGGEYVCTHEIAHLFGCKHENDDVGVPDYVFSARGYDFLTGIWPFRKRRLTIMRNPKSKSTRIMHFSNPDVTYRGSETGVTNSRNNAAQLSDMACHVSDYFVSPEPFSVSITGPRSGENFEVYEWCASFQGCNNIQSVIWEYSHDGFNYFTNPPFPAPTTSGVNCVSGTLNYNQFLYIRVTATCLGGQTASIVHFVWNSNFCGSITLENNDGIFQIENQRTSLIHTYPNPGQNTIAIEFDLLEDSVVEFQLMDLSGKYIKEIKKEDYSPGKHVKYLDISLLQSGQYVLVTIINNEITNEKILKL